MNIGKSITPIMPPKVETDKAFPRLLPKYLAIVVSPACTIAPCPKKRNLYGKFIRHEILPKGGKTEQALGHPVLFHHGKGIETVPRLHSGGEGAIDDLEA